MKIIIVALALMFSSLAVADKKELLIEQLMETQGLLQMFEDQLALSRTQGQEQGRAMVDQMMAGLNPTPEFSARFDQAFDQFMSEIETPWSASEIVSVWAKYYG